MERGLLLLETIPETPADAFDGETAGRSLSLVKVEP